MIRHESCLTREQTLSFGTVGFASRVARDNQATNVMEIKAEGRAFAQIADMRGWVDSLYASNKITAPLTVTGYSLGGHRATAFNLLHQGELTAFGAPLISATYTFNGAGVGQLLNGKTLRWVMARACACKSKAAIHARSRSARHD